MISRINVKRAGASCNQTGGLLRLSGMIDKIAAVNRPPNDDFSDSTGEEYSGLHLYVNLCESGRSKFPNYRKFSFSRVIKTFHWNGHRWKTYGRLRLNRRELDGRVSVEFEVVAETSTNTLDREELIFNPRTNLCVKSLLRT